MSSSKKPISETKFFETIQGTKFVGKKDKEDLNKILDRAYDIRKTELDLYWKRATYFWGFLIAIFTAYFLVSKTPNNNADFSSYNKFLVICLGTVFSLAWYLVNRGSTYWLTHWERIIDTIETKLDKKLYKVNLKKEFPFWHFGDYYPSSVSRINIKVSFFIFLIWIGLLGNFILNSISKNYPEGLLFKLTFYGNERNLDWKILLPLIVTIAIAVWLFLSDSRSESKYSFYERDSEYDKNIKDND